MGKFRAAVVAAAAGSLIMTASAPAVAADRVLPQATFLPAGGSIVHGVVEFTVSDVSENVTEIALLANGRVLSRATEAPWTLTWDTVAVPSRGVLFRIIDSNKSQNLIPALYRVDNYGPSVSLDYGDSEYGVVGKGRNLIWGQYSDVSGVARSEFLVGGVVRSTGEWIDYDFGTTSRTVTGEIRAWDSIGNRSVTPVSFQVDASGPKVTSLLPAQLALVRGTRITSTVAATDAIGVQWATLDNGTGSDRFAPYRDSVPAGKDGLRVLTWYLVDDFGQSTTARRSVIVDNTRPALRVTKAPANKAKVKGTVKISAAASDRNGVARVELLVNGKIAARDTKAAYSFSINTAKYGKTIKVALRAYDRAGNVTATATRTWRR
uniref:Ig-like domain-containing protein n=1 Tax=Paractinoplanes polyasparticus TaxID=2856853 RepID=UPI001C8414F9|nr:Ig-like domain-containing protein [Actinoplanes polyasparticus]